MKRSWPLRVVPECLPSQIAQPSDTRKPCGRSASAGILLSHWCERRDLVIVFPPLIIFPGHTSCQYKGRNVERVFHKGRNYDPLQYWVRSLDRISPSRFIVTFLIRYILSDPKVWGDPEAFRPERFLGPGADDLTNLWLRNEVRSHCGFYK